MLGVVLESLGYEQNIESLAVPVTYESLKNCDIDAFLGNWMPAQTHFVEPLINSGDLVVLGPNLDGIRFTLALPTSVAEHGVKDFKDLAPTPTNFDRKI